ncbi:alkylation response protein AidB-like acyl-CoA dehydrogenase [Pseudoduganella lurida]|uniref:Alkylation response protein AidB-like acyl-CoA dehydrogenase n=1 Tax=Pseudoduganella lurida TaxID=1036180 RepID=A0A562RLD4_9BURK|nr:acyl-CoA dehydrogenase family protein [Pseudoduganella lurida]TWI69703.1 alkylation response protein AidB-like acyl-CoA dehydrogenase [Pseudoduganella lurida]
MPDTAATDTTSVARKPLPADLQAWLEAHTQQLDTAQELAGAVLPQLAAAGLFRIGVPEALGGSGGDVRDAIDAIAAVAEQSLTSAFVFWGHRTFIEYVLQSSNDALKARWLQPLLAGEHAGATGLSNAMKFLSGIESLQITAAQAGDGWQLDGGLAWITNLRKEGFVAAAAVNMPNGAPPAVMAFAGDAPGVTRSPDLDLMALRGSNTAAVWLNAVPAGAADVIALDARKFLPAVRPAFLGMQCGMSIGLARASLRSALALCAKTRNTLTDRVLELQTALDDAVARLLEGVHDGRFQSAAAPMFRLRITLAEIVQAAVMLELQASGGRAYLRDHGLDFARRWRESAFIPIVTPSLTQLQIELQKQSAAGPASATE